jgi:hypothetical protein
MNLNVASLLRAVIVVSTASALAGCMAASGESPEGLEETSAGKAQAVSTGDVVARAREWVNVQMPYCGGPNGGADVLCGGTCVRTGASANAAWDAYRSDCSGLVSYAWGLPAPGRITSTLPAVSQEISGWDLEPGDILNNSYHVVLFSGWVNRDAGTARVIHEPDCGRVASEVTVQLGLGSGSYVTLWSDGYTALRYVNIEGGGGGGVSPGGGGGCGDLTYQGACDGNVLSWCEGGSTKTYDCGANGKACGWESDSVGNNCVASGQALPPEVPQNKCGDVDYLGYCDGNTLVWCQEGELKTYACGGMTCAWQSDSEGNNCL